MSKRADHFLHQTHDNRDPSPWLAFFLDTSIPFDQEAKAAFLRDCESRSRQFLLPVIRPMARTFIVLFQLLKILIPNRFTSSKLLHRVLYWGMKNFLSPDANFLVLRHFNLGSEILAFIRANTPGVDVPMNPLRPRDLEAVKDDLFLIHDLNLFNFVINLNKELRTHGRTVEPQERINWDAITIGPQDLVEMPNRWTNILDVTTAIEVFTPVYQLFLTDNDFWRASNSLQLDETIGLYAATILDAKHHMALVNNKHPMVPLSTLRAGYRLVLHGLATEQLHALLVQAKKQDLGIVDEKEAGVFRGEIKA